MYLTVKRRTAVVYRTFDGREPYKRWVISLKDMRVKARIAARVERAEQGNFGDYKALEGGIFELRENFGPGYRIYFGVDKEEIILLLLGGAKSSQERDIQKAKTYWQDFQGGK